MRVLLAFLLLSLAVLSFGSDAAVKAMRPSYFRYRRWDPTHDFYDDYEFSRQVRRPFSPMAYRQRIAT